MDIASDGIQAGGSENTLPEPDPVGAQIPDDSDAGKPVEVEQPVIMEADAPGNETAVPTGDVENDLDAENRPSLEITNERSQMKQPEDTGVETTEEGEALPTASESASEEEKEDRSWFVIHCYSGYENKVRHNLEQRIETMGMKDKIFDVVIPTQEEIEVKDGKRRVVERHVFPGYILVNMEMSEESWYVVRNTPGVTGFVGMGNDPTPLRPEEVQQILRRMEAEAPHIKVTFKVGERVRIVDGPFNDFRGSVDDIDMERNKVRVMVNFFGRETPVELDFLQVEKA